MFSMNSLKHHLVLGILALSLLGAGCKETWIGFYYPDPINLSVYERSPALSSLNECKKWVENQQFLRNAKKDEYGYECGVGCEYKEEWKGYVCDETVK